jgi:site-specific DNA-methyltransferase (adenine-specific)
MLINGNSLEELKKFPDNYFHSVVTDPPYGLSFMGKKWDYDVPSVGLWQEVLRVLKEGGYLLSFSGTRTQHRMAVNIEDAGFEIRDMIAWVYGSGFPKSHNIGKAIDKLQGNEREITGINKNVPKSHNTGTGRYGWNKSDKDYNDNKISKGNSQWEGWGTALKPALEPITMARKPFKTTVANNVLKNGVGGINIDGCRVGVDENEPNKRDNIGKINTQSLVYGRESRTERKATLQQGRFPANFIHDGSDEVKDLFPHTKSGNLNKGHKRGDTSVNYSTGGGIVKKNYGGDNGNASRFFYCAKANKKDRNEGLEDFEEKEAFTMSGGDKKEKVSPNDTNGKTLKKNNHPTVKPTDLMRYLVRLVTPKNGIVLDCFMGSGSTGKACALEGFNFVGIDLDKDYCKIAKARIDKAIEDKRIMDSQTKLF